MKIYVVWYFWTICWWHHYILLDLIYGQCYPFHAKTTSYRFTFVLVIVTPIILMLVLKLHDTRYLLWMFFWNYLAITKPWITSRFCCVFHITQFVRNVGFILKILIKYSLSWILFPMSRKSLGNSYIQVYY